MLPCYVKGTCKDLEEGFKVRTKEEEMDPSAPFCILEVDYCKQVVQTPKECVANDHTMVHPSSYLAYYSHFLKFFQQ
jgi:hypothetical protein